MMDINVNRYSENYSFYISGVSYVGAPRSNSGMFVTKKVEHLISNLKNVENCLVFAEKGIEIPSEYEERHCFVFSADPQREYAILTELLFAEEEKQKNNTESYITPNGARISVDAKIGNDTYIESGAIIGPGVIIGENARIYAGAVVKNAVIGNNVIINEYAVVGANGFTMADDAAGNKIRIYSLGKVIVGNNVEIGAHDNISRGSGGDTILEDSVKIDALVHIGHDVHLHKNVEITAGAIVGGFVEAQQNAYIGINSVIRNRVELGARSYIGMGSTVTKSVADGITVVGNPAKPFEKKQG